MWDVFIFDSTELDKNTHLVLSLHVLKTPSAGKAALLEAIVPIVKVYGVPEKLGDTPQENEKAFADLCKALREACTRVSELKLTADQVTVFFPRDCMQTGLGEEIIVEVMGLSVKPERTPEVKKRLAEWITRCITAHLEFKITHLDMVEVLVFSFNPEVDGYNRWDRKGKLR